MGKYKDMKKYRVKTWKEFVDEYGNNWREELLRYVNRDANIDHVYGHVLNPFENREVDRLLMTFGDTCIIYAANTHLEYEYCLVEIEEDKGS